MFGNRVVYYVLLYNQSESLIITTDFREKKDNFKSLKALFYLPSYKGCTY